MPSDQYITLRPEHIGPHITAFGLDWLVGKIEGSSARCGFDLEDVGKRLYLTDGHLVLESDAERRARLERPQQPVSPIYSTLTWASLLLSSAVRDPPQHEIRPILPNSVPADTPICSAM